MLVDDANALVRDTQSHIALLGFQPETLALQIRQKAATRLIVCVRNVVAAHRAFPGHLANLGHWLKSLILQKVTHDGCAESATLYQCPCRNSSAHWLITAIVADVQTCIIEKWIAGRLVCVLKQSNQCYDHPVGGSTLRSPIAITIAPRRCSVSTRR